MMFCWDVGLFLFFVLLDPVLIKTRKAGRQADRQGHYTQPDTEYLRYICVLGRQMPWHVGYP